MTSFFQIITYLGNNVDLVLHMKKIHQTKINISNIILPIQALRLSFCFGKLFQVTNLDLYITIYGKS